MDLYTSPMACSLASHIAAFEADLPVRIRYVNTATRTVDDGGDYLAIAPNGYVPALRLGNGQVLNEGASVLQYLADQRPEAGLAPAWGTPERYRLIDTLNYLATEVHQRVFHPIFATDVPDDEKARAKAKLEPALDAIATRLGSGEVLVGNSFTVADAYLVTLLNWFRHLGCDLTRRPSLNAYHRRHLARPAVRRAIAEEMAEREKRG
jgi:glutathione S-transferase